MPVGENYNKKLKELKEAAIIQASLLYHYKLVARAIGKDEKTLINWRKDDEDFSSRIEQARSEFLRRNVKRSKPEFLLERLEPEVFGAKNDTNINITFPSPILGGQSRKVVEVEQPKQLEAENE